MTVSLAIGTSAGFAAIEASLRSGPSAELLAIGTSLRSGPSADFLSADLLSADFPAIRTAKTQPTTHQSAEHTERQRMCDCEESYPQSTPSVSECAIARSRERSDDAAIARKQSAEQPKERSDDAAIARNND